MTDQKQLIFEAFLRANGVTKRPDFRNHTMSYRFPNGHAASRSQIIGSAEYAGFADGFQGLPHRHRRPVDDEWSSRLAENLSEMAESEKVKRNHQSRLDQILEAEFPTGIVSGDVKSILGYDAQYRLGMSVAK